MKKVVLQKNAHKQYLQNQQKRRNNIKSIEYIKIGISFFFLTFALLGYWLLVNNSSTIGYKQRQLAAQQKLLQHQQSLTKLHILEMDSNLLAQASNDMPNMVAAQKSKIVKNNVYVVKIDQQLAYKQ